MPYPTFTNTMADIVIELSDREIYNDIRSQIDITDITVVEDYPNQYDEKVVIEDFFLGPLETKQVTVDAEEGDIVMVWLSVEAYISYGLWLGDPFAFVVPTIISQTSSSITVSVTNPNNETSREAWVRSRYQYLALPASEHEETQMRTLVVRATDATSIAKYGRRVMNLTWPLGQSQQQMQSLVEGYLERYKDAVVVATMRIQGTTDALVVEILTRKVSDRITVNHTLLAMVADFFINSVNINHDSEGLLEANWTLEQVRGMESASIFTLDISSLDGPDILGW